MKIYLDSYAIELYIGEKRSGKTLSMTDDTYINVKRNPEIQIYSNYWLNPKYFPKVIYIKYDDMQKFFKDKKIFFNSIFLIDEIHMFMNARNFGTKGNKVMSYFIGQIGKRKNILRGTTHFLRLLDINLREYCERKIFCYKGLISKKGFWQQLPNYNVEIPKEHWHRIVIKQERLIQKLVNYEFINYAQPDKFIYAKPLFDLYDTEQVIELE